MIGTKNALILKDIKKSNVKELLDSEIKIARETYGKFNSTHELYAVLKEEVEELWDSIKKNEVSPYELLQIIAVANRGLSEILEDIENDK